MKNLKLNLLEKKEMNEVRGGQFDFGPVVVGDTVVQCKCSCKQVNGEVKNGEYAKHYVYQSKIAEALKDATTVQVTF